MAGTSAKELPSCTDLKFLIRGGIPYQYKVRFCVFLPCTCMKSFDKRVGVMVNFGWYEVLHKCLLDKIDLVQIFCLLLR